MLKSINQNTLTMKIAIQLPSIRIILFIVTLGSFITLMSCSNNDDLINPNLETTFLVTIENVSNNTTLPEGSAPDRTAPTSYGVWALIERSNIFGLEMLASEGTSRLAEDGFITVKSEELSRAPYVITHGQFRSITQPGELINPEDNFALMAGEKSQFEVVASPGQRLQLQTMFVQSNDWFYAFSKGGLDLYNGNTPISGDVTSELFLYDAGTEADEPLGLGTTQKPDQDRIATNVGPDDPEPKVKLAMTKHPSFYIPPTSSVLKVTVQPVLRG